MTPEELNLLVKVPVSTLESVTGLQDGELLFYDTTTPENKLKKISIDTFNNLSKSAKPLSPSDPTPTEEGLYKPTIAGTYTNAGGLIAQESYDTLFFFDGTNWTKSETKLPITKSLYKTLFSFKRLQLSDVTAVGVTADNTNEGLRIQRNNPSGTDFTTQLIANNFYQNNDTDSPYFYGLSDRCYQKIVFKQNSLVGTGGDANSGIGLSHISGNNYGYNWSASATFATFGVNKGKIVIQASRGINDYAYLYSDESLSDYELGDIMEMTFERNYHDYIITVKNLSKGNEINFRVTPKNSFSVYIPYNTAFPAVSLYSGDFVVYSWEYGWTMQDVENKIEGDSITAGQDSVVEPLRWAAKVGVKANNMISGGGADGIRSLRFRLQEIYILKPKRIIIMIGGNDILLGMPTQVWKDNLDFVVYHLIQNGIPVVLCYPSARAGAGELINYMNTSSTLASVPKIDCNTPTAVNGTTDTLRPDMEGPKNDHLHPNNYGHQVIADAVNNWLIANT